MYTITLNGRDKRLNEIKNLIDEYSTSIEIWAPAFSARLNKCPRINSSEVITIKFWLNGKDLSCFLHGTESPETYVDIDLKYNDEIIESLYDMFESFDIDKL